MKRYSAKMRRLHYMMPAGTYDLWADMDGPGPDDPIPPSPPEGPGRPLTPNPPAPEIPTHRAYALNVGRNILAAV